MEYFLVDRRLFFSHKIQKFGYETASASSFCSIALVPSAAAAAFDFSWDEATHTLTVASSADRGEGDNGILLSTNNSYPGELTSNEHFAAAEKIIFDLSDPGTSAVWFVGAPTVSQAVQIGEGADMSGRSEERRVGKECRSRWSPYH